MLKVLIGMAFICTIFATSAASVKELPVSFSSPHISEPNQVKVNLSDSIGASVSGQIQLTSKVLSDKNFAPNRYALPIKLTEKVSQDHFVEDIGSSAVWRIKFTSDDAKSMNLKLSHLSLNELSRVYFYSADRSQLFGPLRLNADGEIWTPTIERNATQANTPLSVVLEINSPINSVSEIKFKIDSVNLGFRSLYKASIAEGCQFDVVCEEAAAQNNQARSVAKYSILGQFFCSGTLVNSTLNDNRPFFLTAKHCEVTNSNAKTMVFYWNYQATVCDGERDGDTSQSTSGASLRAYSESTDFALLELDEMPPASFIPRWSGWNASDITPVSTYSIHHPNGLEKSISFDTDTPEITQAYSDLVENNASFWRVNGWEQGSTTDGSSGAGLWSDEGFLIGTLTGGFASCEQPQAPDWYGRLYSQWQNDSWKHAQLKFWLAPDNSDLISMNGSDTCAASNFSIQTSNSTPELNEQTVYSVNNVNSGATVEWDFNDDGIYEASGEETSYIHRFIYQGNIRVRVTESTGCSSTLTRFINVKNSGNETYPIGGRLSALWNQTRTSEQGWRLDTSRAFEGRYSLKSDRIQNGEIAGIEFIHNYSSANNNFISFAVSTSTQEGDKLKFYIDNELVDQWQGVTAWQVNYYPLEPGLHVFKWEYEKDDEGYSGSDAVWIDAVSGYREADSENERSGGGGMSLLVILLLLLRKKTANKFAA